VPIKYDVNFINPFLHAVMHVLNTMAEVDVTPGKPYINKKRVSQGDITGLIGITGYSSGTVSLSLSEGAVLSIVNNMLMENYTELEDEIADAVGEITNMVVGQARTSLSEQGMSLDASTPSVVVGRGHKLGHVSNAPILAIPFKTDKGEDLIVEVCFTGAEEAGS